MLRCPLYAAAVLLVLSFDASAHFVLSEPPSWTNQSAAGDPQKSAPCGQDDPGVPAEQTHVVTVVDEGSMLSITVNETIFHPGHFRVQIAQNPQSLLADPPVTVGDTACGSTVIDSSPTLPLLGDGLLSHTSKLNGPQTFKVQLPAGFTCDGCMLQVVQFMSSHGLNDPGGCFYHHCANVTVRPLARVDGGPTDAGLPVDAGTPMMNDAGPTVLADGGMGQVPQGGCGCRAGPGALLALAALALLTKRRSR
ncbi:MAG: lytic polysaccharide monooxygenase [Myxococcaceae bacterium]|nr:lytic polysaccharide monooxygenase [Myxococcaceae bacterium]